MPGCHLSFLRTWGENKLTPLACKCDIDVTSELSFKATLLLDVTGLS